MTDIKIKAPEDIAGKPVAVGDRIAYATLSTRTVGLRTGVVLAVVNAEEKIGKRPNYKRGPNGSLIRSQPGSPYYYEIDSEDEYTYWTRASVTVKPEQAGAKTVEKHEFVKL